jgi:drug/metabolite transporter (DMT)-like permease
MTRKSRSLLYLGIVVFVNLLWAAQYPAYKIASDALPAATLNFWTFAFALMVLAPCRFVLQGRAAPQPAGSRPRNGADALRLVVLGLLGIVPPSVLLAWGIAKSSAANASILSLTIPILMSMLAVLMLHERLTWLRVASLSAGLAGTLFLSSGDLHHLSLDPGMAVGNGVIFLSGLGSAFYNAYSKHLMARFSELDLLVSSEAVACVACLGISLVFDRGALMGAAHYSPRVWAAMAVLGLIPWGLAMVLWLFMLSRLDLSQLSVSIYLLPVFGLTLSVLSLHERIGAAQILGSALVLTGTAALTLVEEAQLRRVGTVEANPS